VADPFDVLAEFLYGVVGVGDSYGDHAADALDLLPEFHRLAAHQLLAPEANHLRALALALSATQILASEPQPRA